MIQTPSIRINPRAKRLKMEIGPGGQLVVTSPIGVPNWAVREFIEVNQDWVDKHQKKQKNKTLLINDTYTYLFGNKYSFIYTSDHADKPGYQIVGKNVVYTPIASKATKHNQRLLHTFLRTTCSAYVVPRTAQLAKKMELSYSKVLFKQQKTRWGSCSSSGTLSFNWRLVHFAPTAIDYVIIHELAHIKQPNHSRAFWRLVGQHYPQYAQTKKVFHQYYW